MTSHGLRRIVFLAALLTIIFATAPSRTAAQVPVGQVIPGKYIVLLAEGVDPKAVARQHGLTPGHIYRAAVNGFAGAIPAGKLASLQANPNVMRIEPDRRYQLDAETLPNQPYPLVDQKLPNGVNRIEADKNPVTAGITDSQISVTVTMNIAIIDTGIDPDHDDLNVGGGYNGVVPDPPDDYDPADYDDFDGHGTHVAGIAAAIDNGIGVVGVAPGAKVWAIRTCYLWFLGLANCDASSMVNGIDMVTACKKHALGVGDPDAPCQIKDKDTGDDITGGINFASANMSIQTPDQKEQCDFDPPTESTIVHLAICRLVVAGIPISISAGNDLFLTNEGKRQAFPEAIAVSAIVDGDGKGDGLFGTVSCSDASGDDDMLWIGSFSGPEIDMAAPGVCIESTWLNGLYDTVSGTSMAAPHVAGAVALYLHANGLTPKTNAAGVDAIRQALIGDAVPKDHDCGYETTRTDANEPLLFVNGPNFGGDGFVDPCATPVPVTLAFFQAAPVGDRALNRQVSFEWSTATEVGNVGFHIYVQTEDGRQRVNEELIPSRVIDSIEPQDYVYTAAGVEGQTFFIEDLDIRGQSKLHGPFTLGQAYGARPEVEPIDWAAISAEHKAKEAQRSQLAAAWNATSLGSGDIRINLLVDRDGLHRVSYADLLTAGVDLLGEPSEELAILNQGRPLPVHVESPEEFGPGSYIEFYGQALNTLYTKTNVYTLLLDKSLADRIDLDSSETNPQDQPAPYYMETALVEENRQYSFSAPNGDPWYDVRMLTYTSPKSWSFNVEVDNYATVGPSATLTVGLYGVTNWPGSPDHHLLAAFNETTLADEWFDGLVNHPLNVALPDQLLVEGVNNLRLTMPGDTGMNYDLINLDQYGLTYPRSFVVREGHLTFTASGEAFQVKGLPAEDVVVYRLEETGPVRMAHVSISEVSGAYEATFAGQAEPSTYVVSTVEALRTPLVEVAPTNEDITSGLAQYLIISHPSFSEGLQPLVAAREAQGLAVRIVDVEQVYAQFSHGIFDAQAIRDYIAHAKANMGAEYVLLVGGDTYDYHDYLAQGALSFIPSLYAATHEVVQYAPVDPLFADVDDDNVPDLAIGRFPVRTEAELALMVEKTLTYGEKNKPYQRTAIFAADAFDGTLSFTASSDSFIAQLPAGWRVTKAYLDEVSISDARDILISSLNEGAALASFMGHSGPTVWSFSNLFSAADAENLTNEGQPTVLAQWGCWNTYHVAPQYNTLAHKFLLSGNQGAAAVLGPSTLTLSTSEDALGKLVMPRIVQPGLPMGTAILMAKQELAATDPDLVDVLLGWTLLGDPAMVVDGNRFPIWLPLILTTES